MERRKVNHNIVQGYLELFIKDSILPPVLRSLPYDPNSAMHFGERDYSKNGHRTIIFKNHSFRQNRYGMSPLDVKKIELIYGPQCKKRDRAEKVALCQSYPGIVRRKREVIEPPANRSLRVNPDITPPLHILAAVTEDENQLKDEVTEKLQAKMTNTKQECSLKTLGIVSEADKILDLVYQLSNLALKNARQKYCNISSNSSSDFDIHYEKVQHNSNDVLGVFKILADFAKSIVDDAVRDLTEFCQNSETIEAYQSQCKFDNDTRCPKNYRASKSEEERVTDDSEQLEEGNKSQEIDDYTTPTSLKSNRRKREATTSKFSNETKDKVVDEEKISQKDNIKEKVTQKEEIKQDVVQKEKIKENVTRTDKIKEKVAQKEKIEEKKAQSEKEIKNEGVTEMSLKRKVSVIRKGRLKEIQKHNSTTKKIPPAATSTLKLNEDNEILRKKLPPISTTTFKVKEDKKKNENLRKFSEKRYRIQDRDSSGDASDITLEKTALIEPEKSLAKNDGSLKGLLVKKMNSVKKSAKVIKEEEIAESVETKEKTKVDEKSAKEVKKAHESPEEIDTEEVEERKKQRKKKHKEEPQVKHKSKKSKRKIPKTVELSQLNKEFYTERKWPDGVVIYTIQKLPDYDLDDMRSRLEEVNAILKEKTCVKLREVSAKEAPGFEDTLILDNSPDYVTGRVGKQQNFGCIELFEGGQHRQHAAMMVMAMLGFYFEVARHDRDKYIRVHNRHIRPDKLHHFEKIAPEATLNITYDYKSAMHPSYQFWRKIGKTNLATVATYKAKDPNGSVMKALGQNKELLSELDILKINSVYGVDCFLSKRVRKERENARMLKVETEMVIQ